jgi:hypothetical protein
MEHTNGSVLERSGSDLKLWIQEMENNAALALAGVAAKEHGQRVVGISCFVGFQFLISIQRMLEV